MNTLEGFLPIGLDGLISPAIGPDANSVRPSKQNQAQYQLCHLPSFMRFDATLSENSKPSFISGDLGHEVGFMRVAS